jgi:hypothetical protein
MAFALQWFIPRSLSLEWLFSSTKTRSARGTNRLIENITLLVIVGRGADRHQTGSVFYWVVNFNWDALASMAARLIIGF